MTKSVPSPSRRPSVGHPSSSSLSAPSPMPNELRNSSNAENCPIRASFDGPTNFEVKHRHNQSIDLSSSLSLFSMPKIPFNNSRQMPICAQCSRVIVDPFILRVQPNLEFHSDCLKCSECGRPLDEHCSAFVRDGKTLCREDYFRLIVPRCPRCPRCTRCDVQLSHSDLTMHARQLVFHLNCFSCLNCQRMLMPGDQFVIQQNEVFCRFDCFELMQNFHLPNGHHHVPPPSQVPAPHSPPDFATLQPPQSIGEGPPFELAALGNGGTSTIGPQNSAAGGANFLPSAFGRPPIGIPPNCSSALSQMASSGASPLSYSNPDESLTPSSTNASTPTATNGATTIVGGQPHNGTSSNIGNGTAMLQGNFEAIGSAGGIAHFASSAGGESNCSSSSSSVVVHKGKKSKKDKPAQRVRTVLNENQLRILKQTYQGNQRPDTNTKEQLVEMTGLNARVIRVWFQNKRCKDKKRQIEQREKQQSQEKDQTIRSVRAVGVGPMIAGSPGPAQLGDQQQSCTGTQQQFLAPVEIRQFPQNARLWAEQRPIGEGAAATQMDAQFHPNGTQSMMMPNGAASVEFLQPPPPNGNFQSLSNGMQLFPQQAMSD
ncbi:hypothetical protein niasHT_021160 [Heterodera trifolii]|uniref:Uncharacterized protein n=1 Tax=Heterodera trifolii TaxID=157864 RepID=A0ABD2JF19_9BILA